ncbi:MAG: TldD/PmbA family protein [Hyphomonas sp.]|jgi:PmbA protein|uniref:TldD/PmbA family protein n=1 Tax=Hyphomonas sp. TaxID=87 RepID=UPI0037BECABA|nr:TldD/PmbA family protein [Hyphomonas sp.]
MTGFSIPPAELLAGLLENCLKAGASEADARIGVADGVSVSVRDGRLESIEREESASVALRCFFGKRQASVSGADLSPGGLKALTERCVAMARAVPEDRYCGLPERGQLAPGNVDMDLSGEPEVPADVLEREAIAAEAAALAVAGIKTVAGCGASWNRSERWVAATNGFRSWKTGTSTSLGLSAVAEKDGQMERDYDSWSVRFTKDRPPADAIGRTAGERTIARLGARKIETQKAAVIFDRRVSDSLLGAFLGAISGPSVARGVSFLKDRMGTQVFARGIYLTDDPHRPLGMGSRAHDGEGLPVAQAHLIEDGRLTRWLLNTSTARQLGLAPNGFAGLGFGDPPGVSTSNVYLRPGNQSPGALAKSAGRGLLVTDMFGPSINPNTGDYSVGVAGFWFEGGEIAYPVSEVTVAGDLPSMFARLIPASDLELRSTRDAPSILIEDMNLAGS